MSDESVPKFSKQNFDGSSTQYGQSLGIAGAWLAPIPRNADVYPGTEIGYKEIVAAVPVVSTTEATGTTIITADSYAFDGAPVLCQVFCYQLQLPTAAIGNAFVVSLFEGSTQITRMIYETSESIATQDVRSPGLAVYRFTPSAGSHTYKVTAFVSSATGSPAVNAGSGGTNNPPPSFIRFAKV